MKPIEWIGIAWLSIAILLIIRLAYLAIRVRIRDRPKVRVVAQYRDPEDDAILIVETQRGDGSINKTKLAIWPEEVFEDSMTDEDFAELAELLMPGMNLVAEAFGIEPLDRLEWPDTARTAAGGDTEERIDAGER